MQQSKGNQGGTQQRSNMMGLNPKLVKALKQQSTYNQGETAITPGNVSPTEQKTRLGRPQNNYPRAPSVGKLASTRTQQKSTRAMAQDQANKSTKIDYSLAMSQIERGVDVSGHGLDETGRAIFHEMTGKLQKESTVKQQKDQTQLAQIVNSAIAQHAQKSSVDIALAHQIGFSAGLSPLEPEPELKTETDYAEMASQDRKAGEMEPHIYAEILQNAEHMMTTIKQLDWQLSTTKQVLKKYKDLCVA